MFLLFGLLFDVLVNMFSKVFKFESMVSLISYVFYFLAIIAGFVVSYVNVTHGALSFLICAVLSWGLYNAHYIDLWIPIALAVSHIAGFAASFRPGMLSSGKLGYKRHVRSAQVYEDERLSELLKDLKSFEPEPIYYEEDLEKQLYQYLRAREYRVRRQVEVKPELKADLVVGDCIIELKIARGQEALQRLLGQVDQYLQVVSCVIAFILDVDQMSQRALFEFVKLIKSKGAKVVIVEGRLKAKFRRRKK